MPSKTAKARKHDKKKNRLAVHLFKKVKQKARRDENREKREVMEKAAPGLNISIIDGIIHSYVNRALYAEISAFKDIRRYYGQ